MRLLIIITFIAAALSTGCNKENMPIKTTYYVPQEVKDFFVNYEVGTCWVYRDTIHPNVYDTIELTENHPADLHNGDLLEKGYILTFKAQRIKNFWISITAYKNNACDVTFNDPQGGEGDISTQIVDGRWPESDYKDSMAVGSKTYREVLYMQGQCADFSSFIYAKHLGLVSYASKGWQGITGGIYVLVKTFKK
jgi:hypothetical protein